MLTPLTVNAKIFPPDNHHREAARIVGNLKGNAALLAAFSFSALTRDELPGTNVDPLLQDAYTLLACLTLALELVAVCVGQQLLYRMAVGKFGERLADGSNDPNRTILSILLTNHKSQFETVRISFVAGICTMILAIAVRGWACYDAPLASAVAAIFVAAGAVIALSDRDTEFEFERVRLLNQTPLSLRESFAEADANGDELLDAEEITQALGRCGFNRAKVDVEALMSRCSSREDGLLDFDGFTKLVGLLQSEGALDECEIRA